MNFEVYWQQALSHQGVVSHLTNRYPEIKSQAELENITDAEYLSFISRRVFRAGMKHSLVDQKWPAFEEAFWKFDPSACQLIDDARFEVLMQNREIIRHWAKMKTVPVNAQMVADISREHGSFGRFISQWPESKIIELWQVLKKRGAYLGGDGASRFLRMVGKDTFVLSDDVVCVLINAGVVTKKPTGQRDLHAVQSFFNDLQQESGLPLSAISMILAMSVGPA